MNVADELIQASLIGEAVDNGPVAVFVLDEDRRFVAVSRAACELVGYSREDILGLDASALGPKTSRWGELRNGSSITGTASLRCKNGTTVEYAYVAGSTTVAGMAVYVSVGAVAT